MSVKRYEVNGSSSVFEDENGSLVDYEDYVSLEVKLDESLRYGRQADATIHNLELQLTDMAVQLANAESKCRELQRDNDSLEAIAVSMRDDMRDARENLEELDNALCELLPGTQYMNPPDGGSVTPLEQVRMMVADYRNQIAELEARMPYGYLRQCDGQIQISIGSERPHNRSGGYATPWFAIYTAAGIGVKGE